MTLFHLLAFTYDKSPFLIQRTSKKSQSVHSHKHNIAQIMITCHTIFLKYEESDMFDGTCTVYSPFQSNIPH